MRIITHTLLIRPSIRLISMYHIYKRMHTIIIQHQRLCQARTLRNATLPMILRREQTLLQLRKLPPTSFQSTIGIHLERSRIKCTPLHRHMGLFSLRLLDTSAHPAALPISSITSSNNSRCMHITVSLSHLGACHALCVHKPTQRARVTPIRGCQCSV